MRRAGGRRYRPIRPLHMTGPEEDRSPGGPRDEPHRRRHQPDAGRVDRRDPRRRDDVQPAEGAPQPAQAPLGAARRPAEALPRAGCPGWTSPVDLVVEGWSTDAELDRIEEYHAELRETLELAPDARIVQVTHHVTHLYSAFHPSPFDVAAGLVVDNQGSRVGHFTDAPPLPAGHRPSELLEVSSFYRCERGGRIECFAKQLWDGDWERPVGLGCFYALLTKMLWPEGEGNEGKVMGLAPFGDPTAMGLPALEVRGHEVFIPEEWLKVFADRETYRWTGDPASFQACADLAAAGQQVWEDALLQLVAWLHEQTGLENLVFAGGCGAQLHRERRDHAGVADSAASSSRRARTTAARPSDARSTVWRSASGCRATSAGSTTSSAPSATPAAIEAAVGAVCRTSSTCERPDDLAAAMVDLLAARPRRRAAPGAQRVRAARAGQPEHHRRPAPARHAGLHQLRGQGPGVVPAAGAARARRPRRADLRRRPARRRSCSTPPTSGPSTATSTRASRTSTAPPGCRRSSP